MTPGDKFTVMKSPFHSSFIHIYHSDILELVYDLAHHESPIAQWLEHRTSQYLEGQGCNSFGSLEISFSE